MMIKREYSLKEILKLSIYKLKTLLLVRSARLIRFPFTVRGRKYIDFGKGMTTGIGCRIEAYSNSLCTVPSIVFGDNVQLNDYVHICALEKVQIGHNVLMASHIYVSDSSHGSYRCNNNDTAPNIPPIEREYQISPVVIGNNVWIGEGAIIMPGVVIGDGTVIGAHSVVNISIPSNCIAVGSPVRVIKKYDFVQKKWFKI